MAVGLQWRHRAGWLRTSGLESTAHLGLGANLHCTANQPRGPGQPPLPSDSRLPIRTVGLVRVTFQACGESLGTLSERTVLEKRASAVVVGALCRGPWRLSLALVGHEQGDPEASVSPAP